MTGGLASAFGFVFKKLGTIKSGNSLFELIIFICTYYNVAAASYLIDHVRHHLPIAEWVVWGVMATAFIVIGMLHLFDEEGPTK